LNSSKNKHTTHGLKKKFFSRRYLFFHNSKISSRGAGILIRKGFVFEDAGTVNDPNDNYMLKKIKVQGRHVILGAIYGPNHNDENFYHNLNRDVTSIYENNTVRSSWEGIGNQPGTAGIRGSILM
jgi:hypothetical protein